MIMVLAVRAKGWAADRRSAGMRGGISSGGMKHTDEEARHKKPHRCQVQACSKLPHCGQGIESEGGREVCDIEQQRNSYH